MKAWKNFAMTMACWVAVSPSIQAQSDSPGNAHKMRFDHTNSMVWVKGDIEGSRARFLIDTGAASTIVDTRFAQLAGLKPRNQTVTVPFVFYPRATGQKVVLDSMRIGSLVIPDQPAVVTDLSQVSSQAGVQVDAIIGMATLCRLAALEIDYETLELLMIPANHAPQGYCPSVSPVVQLTVSGRPTRLLVDTGSKFGLLLFADTEARVLSRVTLSEFGSNDYYAQLVQRPEGTSEIHGLIGSGILSFLRVQFAERRTQIQFRSPLPKP